MLRATRAAGVGKRLTLLRLRRQKYKCSRSSNFLRAEFIIDQLKKLVIYGGVQIVTHFLDYSFMLKLRPYNSLDVCNLKERCPTVF
jgi:hypothetical protein